MDSPEGTAQHITLEDRLRYRDEYGTLVEALDEFQQWMFGSSGEECGEHWYTIGSSPTKHIIDGGLAGWDPETYAETFCRIEHHYRRFKQTKAPRMTKPPPGLPSMPLSAAEHVCKGCWAVSLVRDEVRLSLALLLNRLEYS